MSKTGNFFFYFIILYIFSFPIFVNNLGSIGNILINGALILFLSPIIIKNNKYLVSQLNKNNDLLLILLLIFLYFVIIVLTIFVGSFYHDNFLILRDFYELHKPILYILIILYIYNYFNINTTKFNFDHIFYLIFLILIIFAYFQLDRYRSLTLLYTGENIYESERLTIPFGNPYDYAFVMTFFCIFFFYKYALSKIIFIFPFLISIYLLIETGSRSNAFAFLITFLFFVPLLVLFSNFKMRIKFFFFLKSLILISILFFFLNSPFSEKFFEEHDMIYLQFIDFLNYGEIGESGRNRFEQLNIIVERSLDNPMMILLGNGPTKGLELGTTSDGVIYYSEHLESSITYIYFRYGLIGIILFTLLFLSILRISLIVYRNLKSRLNLKVFNLSFLTWIISIPFGSIGGVFFEQPRSSFFFYLLIGIILCIKSKIKSLNHTNVKNS